MVLPRPNVVGDQPVGVVGRHDAVNQVDLVRQRVHVQTVERARNLVPRVQRIRQDLEPEQLRSIGCGLRVFPTGIPDPDQASNGNHRLSPVPCNWTRTISRLAISRWATTVAVPKVVRVFDLGRS